MLYAGMVRSEATKVALPEPYTFTNPESIKQPELSHLYWRVFKDLLEDDFMEAQAINEDGVPLSEQRVGVRATNGSLVGYGALLVLDYKNQGELGNFLVHPDHRSRGVGKAIIARRLQIAEDIGLTSLYIPRLEPTNTLPSFYEECGFTKTDTGAFQRGINPQPLFHSFLP